MLTSTPPHTDPAWVRAVARWHDRKAAACRARGGPSSDELADMHETTAAMLRALIRDAERGGRPC